MNWNETRPLSEALREDSSEARRRAEDGMDKARRAERVALWKEQADAWLARKEVGSRFTADDLVRDVGLPDEGVARNNVVGAWFSAKAKGGCLRVAGLGRSKRAIGHGNLQRIWELVKASDALSPSAPDPEPPTDTKATRGVGEAVQLTLVPTRPEWA